MKKFYLIVIFFIPIFSIAQSNYKSGYFINLKGDTLHGYFNFKEWNINPERIEFKSSLTEEARKLGITDISYFEISGYTSYYAFNVSISTNSVDVSSAPSLIDTTVTTGNVFLKVLEKGKYLTLYEYEDKLKKRYYIKETNGNAPKELLYGIYRDPNSETNIINKNSYQAQLNQLVEKYQPNNDKLITHVQESTYKDYVLVSLVAQINGSENEETAAKSGKHNSSFRFYAGAAFISSTLKFSNVAPDSHYYGYSSSTSSAPKITAGIDAIANPNIGHLIFRLEFGYTQDKFSFAEKANPLYNEVSPILSSENYKINVFFITPQVIYNIYNEATLKVFIDAGYSINLLSNPNATIVTIQSGKTLSTTTSSGLDANYSTFMFKAGAVVNKRFELYAAYYPVAEATYTADYDTNLSSFQVGVNYLIN